MQFAHPLFLLLILLVPLLLYIARRKERAFMLPHSRVSRLRSLPKSWRIHLQPMFTILYGLGLLALMIALARPQRGLDRTRVTSEGVDLVLLLDLSESMDTPDFTKNNRRISRLTAAKEVIGRFLGNRPYDRIGIVGFSSLPYAVAPLTLDHAWLTQRIESLHTRMLEGRSTAIGEGIASAANRLRESDATSRIIILLTDGANNAGSISPENAAAAAAALDIKIYTIAAGGSGGLLFSRGSQVDEASLQTIAELTQGRFFRARDLDSLEAIYQEIDQLERTETESYQYTRYEELAGVWMTAAFMFICAEELLRLSTLGRLP
jgi:Ca-activated chloride channel family protein